MSSAPGPVVRRADFSSSCGSGAAARYVDEWLRGQAAGGYVEYDPQTKAYSLTAEQAFALTDPDGAVFAPGAFELALGALRAQDKVTEAFRSGAGGRGATIHLNAPGPQNGATDGHVCPGVGDS